MTFQNSGIRRLRRVMVTIAAAAVVAAVVLVVLSISAPIDEMVGLGIWSLAVAAASKYNRSVPGQDWMTVDSAGFDFGGREVIAWRHVVALRTVRVGFTKGRSRDERLAAKGDFAMAADALSRSDRPVPQQHRREGIASTAGR